MLQRLPYHGKEMYLVCGSLVSGRQNKAPASGTVGVLVRASPCSILFSYLCMRPIAGTMR